MSMITYCFVLKILLARRTCTLVISTRPTINLHATGERASVNFGHWTSLQIQKLTDDVASLSKSIATLQGKPPTTLQRSTEMRHLKLQEEMLQFEKAKIELQRQQLEVSRKMLLALESIAARGLFQTMQEQ